MPAILLELIEAIGAAGEAESFAEGFEAFSKLFFGNKAKLISKAFSALSGEQEIQFTKLVGDKVSSHIKSSLNVDLKNKKPIKPINVAAKSGWVEWVSWSPLLSTATLKIQNNPKEYKLPFFPRAAVVSLEEIQSPGKLIWRRYWRVFGKGNYSNKTKNLVRVTTTKKVTNLINVAVPALKVPKTGKRGIHKKNLIKKMSVKTSNTPKTGAKGVTINVKKPKLRKL